MTIGGEVMKRLINNVAALVVILGAGNVSAAGDDKYPAYNFQPTVIYSNAELISKTSGATAGTPGSVSNASAAPVGEFDPKYPVAYFVPSVIYPTK